MSLSKRMAAGALYLSTMAGCVPPGYYPAEREAAKLLEQQQAREAAEAAQLAEMEAERAEVRKKFDDAMIRLNDGGVSLVTDSDNDGVEEVLSEGFSVPFASGDHVGELQGKEVMVRTNLVELFELPGKEQFNIYVYEFEGDRYFGIGMADKDIASDMAVQPLTRMSEPEPGVIRAESPGAPQSFFFDEAGLEKMFGKLYFGLISDELTVSFYDRQQTLLIYYRGEAYARIDFRFFVGE